MTVILMKRCAWILQKPLKIVFLWIMGLKPVVKNDIQLVRLKMKLYKLFKSILEQDTAPVVVCDMDDIIVYMNPSAIKSYHKDLTGARLRTVIRQKLMK